MLYTAIALVAVAAGINDKIMNSQTSQTKRC